MGNLKVMKMEEAISKYVREGDTLFFSGMQHGEPSAAIHEITRQKIDHLKIISALTHTLSILIGEGLVDHIFTGFLPQDQKIVYPLLRSEKLGRKPKIEEYSHFAICLALLAGQLNIPFIPARILLGSDIMKYNPNLKKVRCPFTNEELLAIKSVRPDIGILHCQRADSEGNAQKWGSLGVDIEGLGASRKIIVTTEKIVDSNIIRKNPNMTIVPGFRVVAVVEQPWGAYPSHLAGYYHDDFFNFMKITRNPEEFEIYIKEYVYGTKNWNEYLDKLRMKKGDNYLENLRIKNVNWSEPICTGI